MQRRKMEAERSRSTSWTSTMATRWVAVPCVPVATLAPLRRDPDDVARVSPRPDPIRSNPLPCNVFGHAFHPQTENRSEQKLARARFWPTGA